MNSETNNSNTSDFNRPLKQGMLFCIDHNINHVYFRADVVVDVFNQKNKDLTKLKTPKMDKILLDCIDTLFMTHECQLEKTIEKTNQWLMLLDPNPISIGYKGLIVRLVKALWLEHVIFVLYFVYPHSSFEQEIQLYDRF